MFMQLLSLILHYLLHFNNSSSTELDTGWMLLFTSSATSPETCSHFLSCRLCGVFSFNYIHFHHQSHHHLLLYKSRALLSITLWGCWDIACRSATPSLNLHCRQFPWTTNSNTLQVQFSLIPFKGILYCKCQTVILHWCHISNPLQLPSPRN